MAISPSYVRDTQGKIDRLQPEAVRCFESSKIIGDMQFTADRAQIVLSRLRERLAPLVAQRPKQAAIAARDSNHYEAPLFQEINSRREQVVCTLDQIEELLDDIEVG